MEPTIIHHASVIVGDTCYDYDVTISLLGEVLAVDSLMERLPEAAQKLTLGAGYKKHLQEAHLYSEYLKYALPVELNPIKENETYSFFNQPLVIDSADLLVAQDSLAGMEVKLAALREEVGMQNKQDTTTLPQSSWMKSYCKLLDKYEQSTLSKEEFLAIQGLRMLFLKDIDKYRTAFHYLTSLPLENADGYLKLLWQILPRLYYLRVPTGDPSHLRRELLKVIIKYRGNPTKAWLVNIFQSPEDKTFHGIVANALATYPEQEHYQLIIDYYHANLKNNPQAKDTALVIEGILQLTPFIDQNASELARHLISQHTDVGAIGEICALLIVPFSAGVR